MRNSSSIILAACCLAIAPATANAQDLEGTLKNVKDTATFTIGYRESSLPLSYLGDQQKPTGFSIELCRHVAEQVKSKSGVSELKIEFNPVTSATRIPLVANGTVDIECGSTANMLARQKQVAFSVTTFVPQFKWIVRSDGGIKTADDLKGKTVAVTAGT